MSLNHHGTTQHMIELHASCSCDLGTANVHLFMQIVFAVLGCWGVGIYSAMKIFGGGKKESTPSAAPQQLDKH